MHVYLVLVIYVRSAQNLNNHSHVRLVLMMQVALHLHQVLLVVRHVLLDTHVLKELVQSLG